MLLEGDGEVVVGQAQELPGHGMEPTGRPRTAEVEDDVEARGRATPERRGETAGDALGQAAPAKDYGPARIQATPPVIEITGYRSVVPGGTKRAGQGREVERAGQTIDGFQSLGDPEEGGVELLHGEVLGHLGRVGLGLLRGDVLDGGPEPRHRRFERRHEAQVHADARDPRDGERLFGIELGEQTPWQRVVDARHKRQTPSLGVVDACNKRQTPLQGVVAICHKRQAPSLG
ncbi:MAG TPA: hypothetical protein VGG06_07400, partial [Thermoanaerobaculia bacterium]